MAAGLPHAERLAFGDHHDAVVQQPVQQADRGGVLGKEAAALVEWPVGADAQGAAFVGGGDEAEQQLGAGIVQRGEAELVEQLYRGVADNSVGRVIDTLLRHDLVVVDEIGFAPLDDTGTQLLFRFVAAAYERRALGVASHWPFEQWGRFLPEHVTATSLLDRLLHHATVVVTEGESFRMRGARTRTARSRS